MGGNQFKITPTFSMMLNLRLSTTTLIHHFLSWEADKVGLSFFFSVGEVY